MKTLTPFSHKMSVKNKPYPRERIMVYGTPSIYIKVMRFFVTILLVIMEGMMIFNLWMKRFARYMDILILAIVMKLPYTTYGSRLMVRHMHRTNIIYED